MARPRTSCASNLPHRSLGNLPSQCAIHLELSGKIVNKVLSLGHLQQQHPIGRLHFSGQAIEALPSI